MQRIYLDHNATTPLDPGVLEEMLPLFREGFGNPSSQHWFGQRAKLRLEEARQQLARLIGARPPEIVFVASGTESDNLALRGALSRHRERGPAALITSAVEHDAVEKTARQLEQEGVAVTRLPVDRNGRVDPEAVRRAIGPRTRLVSVMLANSEVGTLQPLREIVEICHEADVLVHSDAVQAVGKLPLDVRELGVDLLSISAHKFHGPKGCGALFIRSGLRLPPQITGGGQERGVRSGTENLPLIAGLGRAAELAREWLGHAPERIARLRDRLEAELTAAIPDVVVQAREADRLPNTTALSVAGVEGDTLAINLDLQGIAVSTGSACSSTTPEPSRILRAMGVPDSISRGTIRISLGKDTTDQEVDTLIDRLPPVVEKLRKLGS